MSHLVLLAAAPSVPMLVDLFASHLQLRVTTPVPNCWVEVAVFLQQPCSWIEPIDSATLCTIPKPCTDDNATLYKPCFYAGQTFAQHSSVPAHRATKPSHARCLNLQRVAASSLRAADHLTAGNCPHGCCLLGSSQVPLWGLLWGLMQSWGAAVLSTLPAS